MQLPIDVWLAICSHISDYNFLWSVLRTVSQHLRDCVEEYFRHAVLRKLVIMPFYSTIHTSTEAKYNFLYVPMQFARLSDDRTRAVFKQAQIYINGSSTPTALNGSLRGWLPFIERFYMETQRLAPPVIGKTKGVSGPLPWEIEYERQYKACEHPSSSYLKLLRDHTSVGRGDRPPYFIHIVGPKHSPGQPLPPALVHNLVHDTELKDLAIDCSAREISVDWRHTLSTFFLERHFMVCAARNTKSRRVHDQNLVSVERAVFFLTSGLTPWNRELDGWRQARRKRLQKWVKQNESRMSKEQRLITEDAVVKMSREQRSLLYRVVDLRSDENVDMAGEIVPEQCAKDYPELMKWPRNKEERARAENEARFINPVRRRKAHRGCLVL